MPPRAAKPVSETRAIRRRPDAAAGPCPASPGGSPARDLPAGTIVDLPSVRYSNGQMEMRPADCATAALMGVVQPRAFEAFAGGAAERRRLARLAACVRTQHSAESGMAAGEYRIAAGEFLKSTGYLLDLRA